MTFRQRTLLAVAFMLVGVAGSGFGLWVGGYHATPLRTQVANGYVGDDQASFEVGDTTYGFESSVNWTDQGGSFHAGGWPACLPRVQPVTGIRIAVATLWMGESGVSQVVWVDCQPH